MARSNPPSTLEPADCVEQERLDDAREKGIPHVRRPSLAGRGFVQGHSFQKRSDPIHQCTACHGGRVGFEFYGERGQGNRTRNVTPDKTVITTCDTGIAAADAFFVLRYLGFPDVRVHDEAWVAWSTTR